jgi:hypothetical protein
MVGIEIENDEIEIGKLRMCQIVGSLDLRNHLVLMNIKEMNIMNLIGGKSILLLFA